MRTDATSVPESAYGSPASGSQTAVWLTPVPGSPLAAYLTTATAAVPDLLWLFSAPSCYLGSTTCPTSLPVSASSPAALTLALSLAALSLVSSPAAVTSL